MLKGKIAGCAVAAALSLSMVLTGCGGATKSAPETSAKTEAAATETTTTEKTEAAKETTTSQETTTTETPAAAPAQDSYIGEEAAKAAALNHAGIAEADTTELKVELDTDDATVHYDVEFKSGGMEYDYDIDATTGAVIASTSEVDD